MSTAVTQSKERKKNNQCSTVAQDTLDSQHRWIRGNSLWAKHCRQTAAGSSHSVTRRLTEAQMHNKTPAAGKISQLVHARNAEPISPPSTWTHSVMIPADLWTVVLSDSLYLRRCRWQLHTSHERSCSCLAVCVSFCWTPEWVGQGYFTWRNMTWVSTQIESKKAAYVYCHIFHNLDTKVYNVTIV